jgi:PQQ-like domain
MGDFVISRELDLGELAQKVLAQLEAMGILDPQVIADLRRYLQDAKQPITAEVIVKLLVDKRQLTPFQAKKLLTDSAGTASTVVEKPTPKAKPIAPPPAKKTIDEDELMLLDDPATPTANPTAAKPKNPDDEIVDLEEALPPPTTEAPIKATLRQVDTPAPQPGEKKKKRVIMPPAPTAITTDDLMAIPPTKPSAAAKPTPAQQPPAKAPPPKKPPAPPANAGLETSIPGLQPLTQLPATPAVNDLLSAGLTPLGGSADPLANLSPLGGLNDPLGGMAGDAFAEQKPPPEPEKPKLKKKKAGTWDSALLMMGGGGLAVLLLAFVILYYALGRRSSTELLDKAHEAYKGAQYPTAQLLYEKFVKDFPSDPETSVAKVRIGMTQLRQSFDGVKDHTGALRVAKAILPKIEAEKKFDEIARPELQSILPDIADGFATQAKKSNDISFSEKMVGLANEAMELVNNPSYLPTTRRKEVQPKIDSILEKIQVADRAIHQDKALQDALLQIEKKLEERSITGANAVRDQLLQVYPQLERNAEVQKASASISDRERAFVSASSPNQSAATDPRYAAQHDQITLAKRKGATLPDAEGTIAAVLVRGAVYALEVSTGKVKWRRFVGVETKIQPQLLPNGDFLLADQRTHDLMRIGRDTNKIVWRQALEESFQSPVIRGDQLYVTLRSGKLLQLNLNDGAVTQSLTFPQKLLAELGVDPQTSGGSARAYQVGERATLFTCQLSDTTGAPLAVNESYYLGHKPGSITVPPVVVLGHIFVFENAGIDYSRVHILTRNDEKKLVPLREPIQLNGRVLVPPVSSDNKRLVVVTDVGDVTIFAVDLSNAENPVSVAARMTGSYKQPTLAYHVLQRNKLYVADTRLGEYDIQTTDGSLTRVKSEFDDDTFVSPIQIHGRNLLVLRQRRTSQAITVLGQNLDQKKSWELQLAAPIVASYAFPETRSFSAITPDGELFQIGMEQFKERVSDMPAPGSVAVENLRAPIALSPTRQLFLEAKGKGWLQYEPTATPPLKRVELTGTPAIASLNAWGEGVLAASDAGSIWWLSPTTGQPMQSTTPFQPPLGTDTKIHWLPPVVCDETHFAAINVPLKTVHVVRREEKPQPFLSEIQKVELGVEPLAAVAQQNTLLVVLRGEAADEVRLFGIPTLELKDKFSLEGRLTPRGIDVLTTGFGLETAEKQYVRIDAAGKIAWRIPLTIAPLAGAPGVLGNELLLYGQNGDALVVNEASGEARAGTRLGEPVLGAPRVLGKRVLLNGIDGTLHIVPAVSESPEAERGVARP